MWPFKDRKVKQAHIEIDALLEQLVAARDSLTGDLIMNLIEQTIHHGAPIYNDVSHTECATLYLKTAQGAAGVLKAALATSSAKAEGSLLRIAYDEFRKFESVRITKDDSHNNAVAWQVRHGFDRVAQSHEFAALLSMLVRAASATHKVLPAPIVQALIEITIEYGAPIYNKGFHRQCAEAYLYTTALLLQHCNSVPPGASEFHSRTKSLLEQALDESHSTLPHDPTSFAWTYRRAFDLVIENSQEIKANDDDAKIDSVIPDAQKWASATGRYIVAIVFTDIIGCCKLNMTHGDAEWLPMRNRHFDRCRELIAERGGKLINTMGDGVFAVFTDPIAAVDFAERIEKETGQPEIHVRIGIHIGNLEMTNDDVTGNAVNRAARIMGVAEDGGICICPETYRHCEQHNPQLVGSMGWKRRDDRELKGFPGVHTLWHLPPRNPAPK